MGRLCIVFASSLMVLAVLDCGDGPGSGGTAGGGGGGTTGAGGAACSPASPLVTSTVMGQDFDNWEGEPVRGDFLPAQSYPPGSDTDTVVSGRFSLTTGVCTGQDWHISVGATGHQISCRGAGAPVTPADCWCQSGSEWAQGGASGHDCAAFDAGARDAPPGN